MILTMAALPLFQATCNVDIPTLDLVFRPFDDVRYHDDSFFFDVFVKDYGYYDDCFDYYCY
jgi:hypothetical protein